MLFTHTSVISTVNEGFTNMKLIDKMSATELNEYSEFRGSSLNRNKRPPIYNKKVFRSIVVKNKDVTKFISSDNPPINLDEGYRAEYQVRVAKPLVNRRKKSNCLSQRTKQKIKHKLLSWSKTKEFDTSRQTYFNFITLTFTEITTQQQAVKMLNHWLTLLRQTYGKINYLWVAELQDGKRLKRDNALPRNQIHFHIIVDEFFCIHTINDMWLNVHAINGFKVIGENGKKHNPVDVKNIKTLRTLQSYITKYVTKNNETGIEVARWSCSRSVSKLYTTVRKFYDEKDFYTIIPEHIESKWVTINEFIKYKPLKYTDNLKRILRPLYKQNENFINHLNMLKISKLKHFKKPDIKRFFGDYKYFLQKEKMKFWVKGNGDLPHNSRLSSLRVKITALNYLLTIKS